MYWQASKVEKEEVGELNQLLKDLFISFIDAVECLHQSNCVSMNLHGKKLKCCQLSSQMCMP